ncbi:MAG: protein YgfX [Acidiferrobacterales bacterium]
MSERSDDNLIFDLKGSLTLTAIMLALHVGAWLIVLSLPISWWLRIALSMVVVLSLYHTLWLHALRRASHAVSNVMLEGDGDWTLRLQNSDGRGPCRLRTHYVHPWVVLVQLRCPGAWLPVNLVIPADAVDADAFRRLRARLKLQSWAE